MGESATADDPTVEAKPALPGQIKPSGSEADQMPKYSGLGAAAEEVGVTTAHATNGSTFLRPGGGVRQSEEKKTKRSDKCPVSAVAAVVVCGR